MSALDSSSMKVTSYPLVAKAGIATLLSLKTTVDFEAGYTNGFYTKGPSFSAPVIGADIGYRYSALGRVTAGYDLMYVDSINANFYRDHIIHANLIHEVNPFVFALQPELHLREYDGVSLAVPGITGPDTRNDTIFAVVAGLRYIYRGWLAVSVDYRFTTDQTDYRYTPTMGMLTDPSYARHELLAGVRVAM
jgi:opacity protein-like surface antigen